MSTARTIGWVVSTAGTGLWIYGYCISGHPSLFDWKGLMPWWIADFLPNFESEIGLALSLAGYVPIYWPRKSV